MNIKELIMLSDIYAPEAYADYAETPWGIMFYDLNNPTMHDVNHACILDNSRFNSALADIKEFYIKKVLFQEYIFTARSIGILKNQWKSRAFR